MGAPSRFQPPFIVKFSINQPTRHLTDSTNQIGGWHVDFKQGTQSLVYLEIRKSGEVHGGFWSGGILGKEWPNNSGKAVF